MMSSQAERIRAFKHAQHARLQKQDEEEWISSEELCTEGSSDEETHHMNTKRKPKRTQTTEKRGISPLAQPPKTLETESTSTYQRDSKYLLPDLHSVALGLETTEIDSKVEHMDINVPSSDSNQANANLSKSQDTSDTSTSSSIEDINDEILWRPKRGSIKLPEFPEGMPVEIASSRNN